MLNLVARLKQVVLRRHSDGASYRLLGQTASAAHSGLPAAMDCLPKTLLDIAPYVFSFSIEKDVERKGAMSRHLPGLH